MRRTAGILLLLAFASGCASTPDSKFLESERYRRKYVERHADLPAPVRESLLRGKISPEMNRDQVLDLFGPPMARYASESGMMEVFVWNRVFIGFDKNGKIIEVGETPDFAAFPYSDLVKQDTSPAASPWKPLLCPGTKSETGPPADSSAAE